MFNVSLRNLQHTKGTGRPRLITRRCELLTINSYPVRKLEVLFVGLSWPMNTTDYSLCEHDVTGTLMLGNGAMLFLRPSPAFSSTVLIDDSEYNAYEVNGFMVTVLEALHLGEANL